MGQFEKNHVSRGSEPRHILWIYGTTNFCADFVLRLTTKTVSNRNFRIAGNTGAARLKA